MVSKAREDLPDPLTPVTTVNWLIGIENEMFLRLLTRAPRTVIASSDIVENRPRVHRREYGRLRKPQIIPRNLWDTKWTEQRKVKSEKRNAFRVCFVAELIRTIKTTHELHENAGLSGHYFKGLWPSPLKQHEKSLFSRFTFHCSPPLFRVISAKIGLTQVDCAGSSISQGASVRFSAH